jgi:hypothetical protein
VNVAEAWSTLGVDWDRIAAKLMAMPDFASRVSATENLCSDAKKIAKKLMAVHHPDKNPGDTEAADRFNRVKQALETIEKSTESLKESYEKMLAKAKDRADSGNVIIIK